MLKSKVFLIAIMTIIAGLTYSHVYPCDVIVVSAKASTTGRPFIMKNRDCSENWRQEIKYYTAQTTKAGAYIMVSNFDDAANMNNGTPVNPSGGVNEAGFAVSCTSVYEDFNPAHELLNINTDLMRHALQQCATIADWESLLKNFYKSHFGQVVSGNFVVIDAHGGAALYECFTGWVIAGAWGMDFRKYDANNGKVEAYTGSLFGYSKFVEDPGEGDNFVGFFARANCNSYITLNYGEQRRERMEELLGEQAAAGRLNYRNCMVEIAKDVYGQQVDGYGNELDQEDCQADYSTTYCISRAATRLSLVVDGVVSGNDPHMSVFWCALGEPSSSVYLPYFAYAGAVNPLAYVDDIDLDGKMYDTTDTSLLTRAANAQETFESLLYESNTGDVLTAMDDKTINKNELKKVQAWTYPLEDYIFRKCEEYMADLTEHPSYVTPENLRNFSNYCVTYGYKNYIDHNDDTYTWTYSKPWDPTWYGYLRDGLDTIAAVTPHTGSVSSDENSLLDSLLALLGF